MTDNTTRNYEQRQVTANTIKWRVYTVANSSRTVDMAVRYQYPDITESVPAPVNEQSSQQHISAPNPEAISGVVGLLDRQDQLEVNEQAALKQESQEAQLAARQKIDEALRG